MILVSGGGGQLAKEIKNISKNNNNKFIFKNKRELDICNPDKIEKFFIKNKIKIFINTAALTKVDLCEKDKNLAMKINYHSIKKIVKLCKKYNVLLIHISTDYVYSGKSKNLYNETSKYNPINIYGLSKLKADIYIYKNLKKFIILRSGWIFSKHQNNFISFIKNSINKNTSLNLIFDKYGNPTSAMSLSEVIIKLINKYIKQKKISYGIYNFSNYPTVSWYQFGKYYINNIIKNKKIKINKIPFNFLNLPAKRPSSTKLSSRKINKYLNLKKICWKDELIRVLK